MFPHIFQIRQNWIRCQNQIRPTNTVSRWETGKRKLKGEFDGFIMMDYLFFCPMNKPTPCPTAPSKGNHFIFSSSFLPILVEFVGSPPLSCSSSPRNFACFLNQRVPKVRKACVFFTFGCSSNAFNQTCVFVWFFQSRGWPHSDPILHSFFSLFCFFLVVALHCTPPSQSSDLWTIFPPLPSPQLKAIQRFRFIISVLYVSFPSVLGAVAILFFYTLWWGVYGCVQTQAPPPPPPPPSTQSVAEGAMGAMCSGNDTVTPLRW